jgi:DNA repair protein RadD
VKPRQYQIDGLADIRAALTGVPAKSHRPRVGHSGRARRVVYVLPTGGGKTFVYAQIAQGASLKGKKILILEHRKELIKQAGVALARIGVHHEVIAPPEKIQYCRTAQLKEASVSLVAHGASVAVASIQTLARRMAWLDEFKPDIVITDECFPAGTSIDGTPIQELKCGDMVRCMDHASGKVVTKPIMRLFKSTPSAMCRVIFDDGSRIDCTPGHPFWIENKGEYIDAARLRKGDKVITLQELRETRGDRDKISARPAARSWGVGSLFARVRESIFQPRILGSNGENKPKICVRQNDRAQSYEKTGEQEKGIGHTEAHRAQAENPGRQWSRAYGGAIAAIFRAAAVRVLGADGVRVFSRAREILWLSFALQNRHGDPAAQNSDRGRWIFARGDRAQAAGRKKRGAAIGKRVVSIEIHKPGGDGEFERMLPDGNVYNIEVDEHHNYFANGVLVHNCHHAIAGTWQRVMAATTEAVHIGVTATPCRTNGQGLREVFEVLVLGPSMADLIDDGYLVPPKIYAPPITADLDSVAIKAGDYDAEAMADILDKPTITGSAVEHYAKHCPGVPAIVFCCNRRHAGHVAEMFREAGWRFELIDGTMADAERDRLITGLGTGAVQGLCSVDLISEGTDIPRAEAAFMLRRTMSESLYLQMTGRVLRPVYAPGHDLGTLEGRLQAIEGSGKTHGLLFDHVGNWVRHGKPQDYREWTLEGQKRRKRAPTDEPVETFAQCPACYHVHDPAPVCPECGHVYQVDPRRGPRLIDGELQEVAYSPEELSRRERAEQILREAKAKSRDRIIQEARAEKTRLREELWSLVRQHARGPTHEEIMRMKPKELRAWIEEFGDEVFMGRVSA